MLDNLLVLKKKSNHFILCMPDILQSSLAVMGKLFFF